MLEHGGRLRDAARRYGIAANQWLDLSTGISPFPYPVPTIEPELWRRLPEEEDDLVSAAAGYYGSSQCLAVPGTQAALQVLPRLLAACRVAVLEPSYAEYAHVWARSGSEVAGVAASAMDEAAGSYDAVVLCNPNNPDGHVFTKARLAYMQAQLAARGGWLIVDEAYADVLGGVSLAGDAGAPGLIVLCSMGKFFGLAGMRMGFVFGPEPIRDRMREELGPWAVSGPARHVAGVALRDRAWQQTARERLQAAAHRLGKMLTDCGLAPAASTLLFQWVPHPEARAVQQQLARRGILVRAFDRPEALRIGLPAAAWDWQRLQEALQEAAHVLS
jgi:cobalamin biosynthetic protein CobC